MKSNTIAIITLLVNFVGLSASDKAIQSNTPNLTQICTMLESIQEKSNGNHIPFCFLAGTVSERIELITEPQQQKCAAHVLSLMNQMILTTNPKKRAEHLQKFSNKFAECDQFVPGFIQ